MNRSRAFSDPPLAHFPEPENDPDIAEYGSESDDDERLLVGSSLFRRNRAHSSHWTPRKRRMSFLQRAATRLRGDRGQDDSSPSSTSSPFGPGVSSPSGFRGNSVNPNLDLTDEEQIELEYPQWLQRILHESHATCVAIAYQLPAPESDNQYATFTPLRCSYPDREGTQGYGSFKYSNFGYTSTRVGSEIAIVPAPKRNTGISQNLLSLFQTNPASPVDPPPVGRLINFLSSATSAPPALDTGKIPVEIWEQIMEYLSRDDIKNLRLVDKATERSTSARLFKTVVVPFTTSIYGSLADAALPDVEPSSTRDTNWFSKGRGLNVFRGFGRHIRNFGMSFEVDEASLSDPPSKVLQQGHESYWGTYNWPFPQYARFKDRADLEVAADETSTMTLAFSHLEEVKHLALSLDAGLGWLGGPDKSVQSKVLRRPSSIFGSSFRKDPDLLAQRQLWTLLENSYDRAAKSNLMFAELVRLDPIESTKLLKVIRQCHSVRTRAQIVPEADIMPENAEFKGRAQSNEMVTSSPPRNHALTEITEANAHLLFSRSARTPSALRRRRTLLLQNEALRTRREPSPEDLESEESSNPTAKTPIPQAGILLTKPAPCEDETSRPTVSPFLPGQLTKDQREWLLESAWAQDAFLSSYLLAVTDNATSFQNVQTLTINRLSSRHLPKLCRDVFWDSMPSVTSLDLRVIADHRDVRKTEAGFVETPSIRPSDAINPFHQLLSRYVAAKSSITTLCIGWVDGGEHAEGLFARNHHILPAPLSPQPLNVDETSWSSHLLRLPHVEELKLVNCWLAPNALVAFLDARTYVPNLKQLCLESVSLTSHPKFERVVGNHNGVPAFHAILMQQLANLNIPVPPAPAGPAAALVQPQAIQPQTLAQVFANATQNLVGNFLGHAQAVQALHNATAQQQLLQQQNQGPAAQAAAAPFHQPQHAPQLREGMWPDVLQRIKKAHSGEELAVTFLSCGYVRLSGAAFDQTRIDEAEATFTIAKPLPVKRTTFFSNRRSTLADAMMTYQDPLSGHIALGMTASETVMLTTTWGFEEGWPSREILGRNFDGADDRIWGKWGEKSKNAAEYDGARRGGTGRFSGQTSFSV